MPERERMKMAANMGGRLRLLYASHITRPKPLEAPVHSAMTAPTSESGAGIGLIENTKTQVEALLRGDESWHGTLEAELIEFGVFQREGKVAFDGDADFILRAGGSLQLFLKALVVQREAKTKEGVVNIQFAGKVVVERRGAHTHAAGKFLHGEGGDAFFAHDGAGSFENALGGGLPFALNAGGGGGCFHFANIISLY